MPIKPIAARIGDDPAPPVAIPAGAIQTGENVASTRSPPATLPAKYSGPFKPTGLDYGQFRPKQGPNGTWHWGIDIPTPTTDSVVAPERIGVRYVWRNNKTAPFVGYGPGGILAQGLTTRVYHLLGHLDPDTVDATVGQVFEVGQVLGHTAETGSDGVGAASPHVHWEVRLEPIDSPATRRDNTLDPIAWLNGQRRVLTKSPGSMPWWFWLLVGWAVYKKR